MFVVFFVMIAFTGGAVTGFYADHPPKIEHKIKK
jgi:hypothetical protein